jgi:choline dehydrogenase-like flavoprotein
LFADADAVPDGTQLETDVCIIGAGAAGITLAREFIGSPLRVSVLESGDLEYDQETQSLYEGDVVGLPYFPLTTARLRYFGGSTNHWGGVCRPLEEVDFEPRDGVPESGWPIRRVDVEPFYPRAAEIVGLPTGDFAVEEWTERDRFAPLPLSSERVETRVALTADESRRRFGQTYRDELGRAAGVTVFLGANAVEIETDEPGATATAVRVATLAGTRFSVAARWFVLAVGGLENPRLLLASNRRRPAGLGNQHDLVGRFFMEHPRFVAGMVAPSHPDVGVGFYEEHSVGSVDIRGYLGLSQEIRRDEGLVDVQVRVQPLYAPSFDRAIDAPDVDSLRSLAGAVRNRELVDGLAHHLTKVVGDLMTWQEFTIPGAPIPVPYPEVIGRLAGSTPAERRSLIPSLLGDIAGFAYKEARGAPVDSLALVTRIEQVPNPDSRVTLGPDRDELGMPRARLDWRLTRLDHDSVRRTLEILGAEMGRVGVGRLKVILDEDVTAWPSDLQGGWHHMGTTRMSDDPHHGVVDRNGRVHGMSNLFVAGSSVFPTAGSGTPTLTIVALALRLADRLKRIAS